MRKIIFLLLSIAYLSQPAAALAVDTPDFPSCVNPQGTLIADYKDGTHGIVGSPYHYSGKDTVYKIDNKRVLQCFCPDSGDGIQTNWWKVNELTQKDIDTLKSQGWHFIGSGAVWGLDGDPYLAKNYNYSCGDNGTGGSILPTSASTSSVLGLASTGGAHTPFMLAIAGLSLLAAGLFTHALRTKQAK